MSDAVMQEAFEELFSSLEALETQTGAILQFLKERGIVSDQDLAPFWEKAAKASNVRWRATRVRINYLLSSASKASDTPQEKSPRAAETGNEKQAIQSPSDASMHSEEQETSSQRTGRDQGTEPEDGDARQMNEGNRSAEGDSTNRPAGKEAA